MASYICICSFILPLNEYGCVYAWKWACDRLTEDTDFSKKKKIIFSDKVHFDLGGCVNKHYYCIWGTENPYAYIEKPGHPKRVTVFENQPLSWNCLAALELRFDTVGLIFVGALKDKCYAHKPEIIDDLKDNTREAIDEV